jgi:hypothetical protein
VSGTVFYRDKYEIERGKIVEFRIRDFNEYSRDDVNDFVNNNGISCIISSNGREPHKIENIDTDIFDGVREFSYQNGNKITLYFTGTAITPP